MTDSVSSRTRALFVVATSSLSICSILPAMGQTSDSVAADLAACSEIESALVRLDCYDEVARSNGASRTERVGVPSSTSVRVPAPSPPIAVTDAGVGEVPEVTAEAEVAEIPKLVETLVVDPVSSEPTADEFSVLIVAARKNLSGLFILTSDSGQVFEQMSVGSVRLSDPPFRANVTRASLGSYFLQQEGERARLRVRLRD